MGEKDILEKKLFMFNDVFADFLNGIINNGRQVVEESELFDLSGWSHYKADDSRHRYQDRDVVKLWKKKNVVISLIGIENQDIPDKDMVFRVLSYDGASYKTQLAKKDEKDIFPVITFVVYYGEEEWKYETTLKKRLKIGDGLDEFVSDYKINLIDLKKFTEDDINKFKKDFKLLVNYMVKGSNHDAGSIELNHPEEVSELVLRLTGEELPIPRENDGGKTMEKFFEPMFARMAEKAEARGMAKGMTEGMAKGMAKGMTEGLAKGMTEGLAKGMTEGMAKGLAEGKAKGLVEGKAEGENRIVKLISLLISDGKDDTVKEVLEDAKLRNRLCEEYGI